MSRKIETSSSSSFLARLAQRFLAWRQYRREMAELSLMSTRELADIGLSRSDLMALRKGTFVDRRQEEMMANESVQSTSATVTQLPVRHKRAA